MWGICVCSEPVEAPFKLHFLPGSSSSSDSFGVKTLFKEDTFWLQNIESSWRLSARVLTSALGDAAVPVVKGAAEDGILARLQHDIAAHEPPHRAAAVSQQAAQRQRAGAVVGDPKHQHAQIQQVALCRVPAPETRLFYFTMFTSSLTFIYLYYHLCGAQVTAVTLQKAAQVRVLPAALLE